MAATSWRQRLAYGWRWLWSYPLPATAAEMVLIDRLADAEQAALLAAEEHAVAVAALEHKVLDLETRNRLLKADVEVSHAQVERLADVVERDRLRVLAEQTGFAVKVAEELKPKPQG